MFGSFNGHFGIFQNNRRADFSPFCIYDFGLCNRYDGGLGS